MIKTKLPHVKEMITEKSTIEEVAVFFASCLGENIAIEYTVLKRTENQYNCTKTIVATLLSAEVTEYEGHDDYHFDLYVEGQNSKTFGSRSPFIVKKLATSAGHVF